MGKSTQESVGWDTTSGTQSGEQTSQLQAAGESPLEAAMRMIAGQIYSQYAGDAMAPGAYGGVTAGGVMAGGVSDAQRAMVADWQSSTLAASRAGMQGVMDETMGTISNQMADRGILDSSAYGAAAGQAQKDLMRQYGQMAANAQAQGAQQLLALSGQNQSVGMNLLQMRDQARQWSANPQLMRDLMEYRLRTGTQYGSSNATTFGENRHAGTVTERKPRDWVGFVDAIFPDSVSIVGGGG